MQGADVTLVVTVVLGTIWVSISPPFTWEAIMEPVKVDEFMRVLEPARDEAKNMSITSNGSPSRTGHAAIRAITGRPN